MNSNVAFVSIAMLTLFGGGCVYPDRLVNKLTGHLRIPVIAVGAARGQPRVALLAIASLTHLAVFHILVIGLA